MNNETGQASQTDQTAGEGAATPAGEAAPNQFGDIAASIGARNLIIAIVTMPLFAVGLVALIIVVFGGKDDSDAPLATAPAAVDAPVIAAPGSASGSASAAEFAALPDGVTLADGEEVADIDLNGDRMVLRITSPTGGRIVIYDLVAGEVLSEVPLAREDQ